MKPIARRRFLAHAASGVGLALLGRGAAAQNTPQAGLSLSEMITPETQDAIDRGLALLVSRQNDDGSFGASGYGQDVAVSGLAGLALMSGGSTPGRGPHGAHVDRCIDYILANTLQSGFVAVPNPAHHGPMYGHGFATLFLAEVYGMTPRSDVREKLSKAVNLIVSTQNHEGGWRYQPKRDEADLSVTICQVMALRAARNAGIFVPNETIDRCIDYVRQSQNADGGFMYTLEGGPSEFARSAAGVVALYSAGVYEGDEIRAALEYLMQFLPRSDAPSREPYYFYGHYYAAQAMWHAGGDYWQQWYPAIRDVLVARQNHTDGAWVDDISPVYATAMACIILQLPNNYLPIFQR